MATDPRQQLRASLLKGATPEQKKAINYFIPGGCLSGKVKDEEYDAIVDSMVKAFDTYNKAIAKIGLDEDELKEIPPVTLYGFEDSALETRTADGWYRTNLYSVTHLFFSSTQVYMYQVIFDTTKSNKKERTEEYFYKDITNFSTVNDTKEVKYTSGCMGKVQKTSIEIQRFKLIVPGDQFEVATFGDIEKSVQAMKAKLREKKA